MGKDATFLASGAAGQLEPSVRLQWRGLRAVCECWFARTSVSPSQSGEFTSLISFISEDENEGRTEEGGASSCKDSGRPRAPSQFRACRALCGRSPPFPVHQEGPLRQFFWFLGVTVVPSTARCTPPARHSVGRPPSRGRGQPQDPSLARCTSRREAVRKDKCTTAHPFAGCGGTLQE